MFKLAGFGTAGATGRQASARVSSALPLRLSRLTCVGESLGRLRGSGWWRDEGGASPELKMAAVSAAPRDLTSGLRAAGASRRATPPSPGVWRQARRRRWELPGWEAALRAGTASGPRLLAAGLAALRVQVRRDCEARVCAPPFTPLFSASLTREPELRRGPGCPDVPPPSAITWAQPGGGNCLPAAAPPRGPHSCWPTSPLPGWVLVELPLEVTRTGTRETWAAVREESGGENCAALLQPWAALSRQGRRAFFTANGLSAHMLPVLLGCTLGPAHVNVCVGGGGCKSK